MDRAHVSYLKLTRAAREVLDLAHRHQAITNESVARVVLPGVTLNAVTKVTASLVASGLLNKFPLIAPQCYFTLGSRAVRHFGVSRRRTQPLGPQSLPAQLGALYYCTLGDEIQTRLLPAELRTLYPWLPASQLELPFYREEDPVTCKSRLTVIRTDTGATVDYLVRRCEHDLAKRRSLAPEFGQLIDAGQFMICLVLPTSDKATAISTALSKRDWPVKFRLAICPELLSLLARLPNGP